MARSARTTKQSTTKSSRGGKGGGRGRGGPPQPLFPIEDASLTEETRKRYLNYALSVITSRALPDARDGLKPVQRRIIYAMQLLRLSAEAKHRKSATVVGEVLGKYHPHGDQAVYDAMVRLAQDWVMRAPLIDGQGNFGSIDGDAPAAMRYTEARLQPVAAELINELGQRTVDWRPNFDGSTSEPIVLPARLPHLLVNGAQGIAVGMATSIPPHNLGETIDACLAMIDASRGGSAPQFDELTTFRLLTHIKGPDFPTGGQLLATKKDLEAVYETGQGSLKVRSEWTVEEIETGADKRGSKATTPAVVVTSIPYNVERGSLVEKIAEVIISKKLPALVDVRDESTTDNRIVMELKKGADPQLVMAYLFKNTPLATNVQVNLTCLVPAEVTLDPEAELTEEEAAAAAGATAPRRLSLREMLAEFLRFRFITVTRRLEYTLGELNKRIHILEGLEIVFDALDEIIRIIRKSDGRADASQKLIKRFSLTEMQTDAILELRLYRLAKLEILLVRKELAEKRAEAKKLGGLLKSDGKRWKLIREELEALKDKYADKRRTQVVGAADEPEFQAEDFIVAEDANVILSAQGWLKRLRNVKDLSQTRLRDGDSVLAATAGSTKASVAFFSNMGACYVARIHDVPASTGYGDPVQKLFKLADGEKMVAMMGFDSRVLDVPEADADALEPEPPYAVALTRNGLGFRFSLRAHRDPSTRAGRKFGRLNAGDEVVFVSTYEEDAWLMCAANDGHAIGVEVDELPLLSGPGKGSMLIKLDKSARVVGAMLAYADRDAMLVETEKGKEHSLTLQRIAGARAGRGDLLVKRDKFARVVVAPPELPELAEE